MVKWSSQLDLTIFIFADMAELAALNTSAAGGRCNECEKVQRSKSFRFRVPQTVSRRVLPMTPYEIN